ncbi:MAG: UDP-N-acetylglucosamine 2-epimerase (non-hydrolyzing), partial [candidate division KSB1 bacterium]|nr:UDP-N-acetylglucosamine 2-epimerase (non-hydrolyzing) [candidate division KSB1 bacterium]
LLLVAGARPNFMKVAPLIHAIRRHNAALNQRGGGLTDTGVLLRERAIQFRLVHTGQHYDSQMSRVFFEELGIPEPHFNLEVGSGSHAVQTATIMTRFEPVLLNAFAPSEGRVPGDNTRREQSSESASGSPLPDWLVVVGDVNSTLACALVASKLGVRVAHVEAGLRSFDRSMPEEINRVVTDAVADLLLAPSEDACENLRREGVPEHKIRLVGNIMVDALVANLPTAARSQTLQRLGLTPRGFIYVTLHRPANVDSRDSLARICERLSAIAAQWPVVFPMHPRTRARLAEFGLRIAGNGRLRLLDPLGYHDSLVLTQHARCVLTDSGGLQEESTYFCTPCLTLRPSTERPVTITLGSNRLTTLERLSEDLDEVLRGPERRGQVPPLWDGRTAERVLEALLQA